MQKRNALIKTIRDKVKTNGQLSLKLGKRGKNRERRDILYNRE